MRSYYFFLGSSLLTRRPHINRADGSTSLQAAVFTNLRETRLAEIAKTASRSATSPEKPVQAPRTASCNGHEEEHPTIQCD